MNNIKFIDLFAGIGGFRYALENIATKLGFDTECIGYSEIDKFALMTYESNYQIGKNELEIGDINKVSEIMDKLDEFDLLFAGFPCQSFSMMGSRRGLEDDRGSVFYKILDIIRNKRPKLFILENVRGLKNHDKGNTLRKIVELLEKESYTVHQWLLDSKEYGVPQTRRRLYLIGTNNNYYSNVNVEPPQTVEKHKWRYKDTRDLLEKEVDEKYYLSDKILKTILANGSGKYYSKSEINLDIARPLTATMHKMHRANQDNYFSDDFINRDPERPARIRKITPKEAFRMQGFEDEFVMRAIRAGVSDTQLYRQAGNCVTVTTIEAILEKLLTDLDY